MTTLTTTPGQDPKTVPKPLPWPRETSAMVRLSDELITAMRAVVHSSAFAGLGPIEVARTLGLDKTSTSRLMSALRAGDSLVALSLLPGVVPMRQFVAAARDHGASARTVQAVERKLHRFDHELQSAFGTRTRLDAVIADALPEARRRHEDGARQGVYRGMALIKGVSFDLESYTWVVHPSRKNPRRVDMLFLGAFVGIHRLRPTARVRLGSFHSTGQPERGAKLLRKFCRPAGLSIAVSSEKNFTSYEISTGSVRRDAAADVFLTELMSDAAPRTSPTRVKGFWRIGDLVAHPVKRLELALLIHRDVWAGCDFSLRAYDSVGMAGLTGPERDLELLSLDAEVVRSLADAEAFRTSPVPNYLEILRHLTTPLGWRLEGPSGHPAFRKISCEIAYPLYGAHVFLALE